MSEVVTDTLDQPITYVNLQQEESTDSAVFVVRFRGGAGRFLTADDHASVRVLARATASGDPFQDIATTPLDTTPYDGDLQDFDIKVHTNAVTGILSVAVNVRVTPNP